MFDHFLEAPSDAKNKCNCFHRKLDADYILIKQFFRKMRYFPRKLRKNVFGAMPIFGDMGCQMTKLDVICCIVNKENIIVLILEKCYKIYK